MLLLALLICFWQFYKRIEKIKGHSTPRSPFSTSKKKDIETKE